MNIYLAGKIAKNGWRYSIVKGLRGALYEWSDCYGHGSWVEWPSEWPILDNAILDEHSYTGPFFVADDHGCFHGRNSHGCGATIAPGCNCETDQAGRRRKIIGLCHRAIDKSDILLAWLDSHDAYGTIAEIGYASAKGKFVYVASPTLVDDLWFVYLSASSPLSQRAHDSPASALRDMINLYSELRKEEIYRDNLESPIEKMFWHEGAAYLIGGLVPQVKVGKYRLDFGIPIDKIGIELDGHAYHSTKKQREGDAVRQRFLESQGWKIIRFTGTEVYRDPGKCVDGAMGLIEMYRGKR